MKIIHTSDWHLGGKLERHWPHRRTAQVDCVFKIRASRKPTFCSLPEIFWKSFARPASSNQQASGGKIEGFDRKWRCHAVLVGQSRFARAFCDDENFSNSKAEKRNEFTLSKADENSEIDGVQFICLPYQGPERLEAFGNSVRRKKSVKQNATRVWATIWRSLSAKLRRNWCVKPAVFCNASAKSSAWNTTVHHARCELPTKTFRSPQIACRRMFPYIALGHILQMPANRKRRRYVGDSGSFDGWIFGERNDEKYVLEVEIDEQTKKRRSNKFR